MKRRVVITGVGLVSALGLDTKSTWQGLLRGTSGVRPISRFDASQFSTRIAAEIKDFDPRAYVDAKNARKMDRFILYAIAASDNAFCSLVFKLDQRIPIGWGCILVQASAGSEPSSGAPEFPQQGASEDLSILRSRIHRQSGRRSRFDQIENSWAEFGHRNRLFRRNPRHRRRLQDHSTRCRGCHDRGRLRSGHHAYGNRRIRSHEGSFQSQ